MKTNALRVPLIKAAAILVIFSLLVYFTSTTPDASVWTSMGAIIMAAFKTLQWLLAMSIGLVISLVVLFAIFFGAVAMVNPGESSRMYEGLRTNLINLIVPINDLFNKLLKSDNNEQLAVDLETFGRDLKKEIRADIQAGQAKLQQTQTQLAGKIDNLNSRIAALEETTTTLAADQQVETLSDELKTVVDSTAEIRGTVESLKDNVAQTAKQVQEVSTDGILGDLPARIEALEQQEMPEQTAAIDITPLEKEIAGMQSELASVKQRVDKAQKSVTETSQAPQAPTQKAAPEKTEAAEKEEHRIFSYFDDASDKQKVADVVASTLKKDMSYKQVMDLLAKELGSTKGNIITSHPSLSKDYIRQCRRDS